MSAEVFTNTLRSEYTENSLRVLPENVESTPAKYHGYAPPSPMKPVALIPWKSVARTHQKPVAGTPSGTCYGLFIGSCGCLKRLACEMHKKS